MPDDHNVPFGVAGVIDIFKIDTTADPKGDGTEVAAAAAADRIAGFDVASDKIQIGAGDVEQTVYVRMDGAGPDADAVIYSTQADAVTGTGAQNVLAVLDNTLVTIANFDSSDFTGSETVTVVHVGGVDSIDGSSAGKQVMVGVDTTADTFKVDAAASAKSEADVIAGFENGTDLIDLGAITDIVLAEDNGDTIVYTSEAERSSGDGTGVLFVIAGVTGLTAADFDDDDFVQDNINITFPDVS